MPDPAAGTDSSETNRRWLLRGGALAAGAAAIAVAAPPTALAKDGTPVGLGEDNEASATTRITLTGSGAATNATLALENADGPTLYLQPSASWESPPVLEMGQIANTILGPVIGVDSFDAGLVTSYLATGVDLDDLPTPYPLPKPVRLLDTRSSAGRARVLRTSPDALDASGRLKPHQWVDVEIAIDEGPMDVPAAHVNVTAIGVTAGYLTVYPSGPFPVTSTLNYQPGQAIANGAFVATRIVLGKYAVRIYSSALTHVVLDLTGVTIKGNEPAVGNAKAKARAGKRGSAPAKGRRTRLAERLLDRLAR